MNIGFDVDAVLVDVEKYQLENGKEFFKKAYNKDIANPDEYDIEDIFACTRKERQDFWKRYIWKYCLIEPMIDNAAKNISMLRKNGHKIFIITSRVYTTEKGARGAVFRAMLKHWLKKNNLEYDKIIFCSEKYSDRDKYKACIENNIDVLIDDKIDNLEPLIGKANVICYTAAWNKNYSNPDVYRANNHNEVYSIINSLNTSDENQSFRQKTYKQNIEKQKNKYNINSFPMKKTAPAKATLGLVMTLSKCFWNIKAVGLENIPKDTNYIICPNHESHLDGVWVLTAIGKKNIQIEDICCMAKKEHLDSWFTRGWLKMLGGIPVDRGGNAISAMQRSIDCVKHGKIFIIHPEGTRTRNGKLGRLKQGASKIAVETGKPILPVKIKGAYEIYPPKNFAPHFFNWKKFKRYDIEITFFAPIYPKDKSIKDITDLIQQALSN